jgi:hypothetical protein
VTFRQLRHEFFSRTCWITFHRRGTRSSVAVTSSPSLCRGPPQRRLARVAARLHGIFKTDFTPLHTFALVRYWVAPNLVDLSTGQMSRLAVFSPTVPKSLFMKSKLGSGQFSGIMPTLCLLWFHKMLWRFPAIFR